MGKLKKIQVKCSKRTPFLGLNPPSRNPGSAPEQSLRIGKIRALNGCTGRLFRAATRHNHKNSDIKRDQEKAQSEKDSHSTYAVISGERPGNKMRSVTSYNGGITWYQNETKSLRSWYCTLFEHMKMLNDCFGNKGLTFQMPKNNEKECEFCDTPVNFDAA